MVTFLLQYTVYLAYLLCFNNSDSPMHLLFASSVIVLFVRKYKNLSC